MRFGKITLTQKKSEKYNHDKEVYCERWKTMKRRNLKNLFIFILAAALLLSLSGCFGGATKKNLLNYFGECKVRSARYYTINEKDGQFFDLDKQRLPQLVEKLESMKLKTKSFHTDYFWGGRFGIELVLEDGTYLTYDGTKLEHRNRARESGVKDNIESVFAEVTNMNFWEEMADFFPMVKNNPMIY